MRIRGNHLFANFGVVWRKFSRGLRRLNPPNPRQLLLFYRGSLDVVHLREVFREVGISLGLDLCLVRTAAVWCAFAVAAIQPIDNIHSGEHTSKRREPLA